MRAHDCSRCPELAHHCQTTIRDNHRRQPIDGQSLTHTSPISDTPPDSALSVNSVRCLAHIVRPLIGQIRTHLAYSGDQGWDNTIWNNKKQTRVE